MTTLDSLAISLPVLISIGMFIIAWQNYKLNKKKSEKSDAKEIEADDARQKEIEVRLVSIEKDVQYIRIMVDKYDNKIEEHDKRLTKLESHQNYKK